MHAAHCGYCSCSSPGRCLSCWDPPHTTGKAWHRCSTTQHTSIANKPNTSDRANHNAQDLLMHLAVPPIILQNEMFSITRARIGAAPERTCTIRLPSRRKVTIRVECQPPIYCSLREGNQTARGISLPLRHRAPGQWSDSGDMAASGYRPPSPRAILLRIQISKSITYNDIVFIL